MNEQTCVIFAAGEYYDDPIDVPDGAFVIAADGGLDHTHTLGVRADVVIGDFDSLHGARPADADRTITLPSEKDDPDLLSAMKVGWSRGCRTFHIYGALGGRIDHTISSIQLTALLAHHGGIGFLHGDGTIVTAIRDGALSFAAHDAAPGRMVSVFAHTDVARGVNEPGLKYELVDGTLTSDMVQGVSNEFRADVPAEINVHDGTLIVTFPAEAPMPRVTRYHGFGGDLGALDTDVSPLLVAGDHGM
ncbi:thiamine pyrophosphokinase [Bifidobacterium ramosum]|uniref:Thiamine diphosphokinase n=1 Tax=Bifidobacterium ramosum TaxID=1798158 RepID=A0A6L4X2B4_9BIFI|nr:thiamine diphosphokinase [Bifidobacterium ramosum]KAB8289125.1 thiamine pyrophosphokinase [Bifidobacterium ramosum]NEG70837.1 thiamine diphosphokinase [Bifidobacterium ramosum]